MTENNEIESIINLEKVPRSKLPIDPGTSSAIDLLKAIFILFTVVQHWNMSFIPFSKDTRHPIFMFLIEIGYPTVEVIIVFIGMLLVIGIETRKRENHSWLKWYKSRLIRIFPLFILGVIINIIFIFYFQQDDLRPYSLDNDLLYLSGLQSYPFATRTNFWGICAHYWFITFLLSVYLIFPLFYYLVRRYFYITLISVIILYVLYVIFYTNLNELSIDLSKDLLNQDLYIEGMYMLPPKYFSFFFGVMFGYWLSQDNMANLKKLKESVTIRNISFISLTFFIGLYLILASFMHPWGNRSYLTTDSRAFIILNIPDIHIPFTNIIRTFIFPMIGYSVLIFAFTMIKKKPNKVLKAIELPGREIFAIYILHNLSVKTNSLIFYNYFDGVYLGTFWFISLPIMLIGITLIAYPYNKLGKWIRKQKKFEPILAIIIFSLILYGILFIVRDLFHLPSFTIDDNIRALLLFIFNVALIVNLTFILRFLKKGRRLEVIILSINLSLIIIGMIAVISF